MLSHNDFEKEWIFAYKSYNFPACITLDTMQLDFAILLINLSV